MIGYDNPKFNSEPTSPDQSIWKSGLHLVAVDDDTSFSADNKDSVIVHNLTADLPDIIKSFSVGALDIEPSADYPELPATSMISFEYIIWGSGQRADLIRSATNGFSIRALLDSGFDSMDKYMHLAGHLATSEQLEADSAIHRPVSIFDSKYEDSEMLNVYYSILVGDGWQRESFIRHPKALGVISKGSLVDYDKAIYN
ncbi:hypothetical protein KBD20_04595 [Candidatus Saccharibacteria bacterium]|nr:hypothetical protein [Candidatus Saccharibacteria bacterium]